MLGISRVSKFVWTQDTADKHTFPGYKRGPTGVREAEVNLKVAFYLRDILQQVGATVVMTRVDDSYVSLAMRSQIANESGADFFYLASP